jgi:hypothetical protein
MTSTRRQKHDGICARISLNVPSENQWCWDEMFNTALVVFDKCDMDLIYIPMTQEFDTQWDFTTIGNAPPPFYTFFNRVFGIVPGQKIFTATDASGTMLFAVWWPWGDGNKISLRVGLHVGDIDKGPDQRKDSLCRWFHIKDQPSDS